MVSREPKTPLDEEGTKGKQPVAIADNGRQATAAAENIKTFKAVITGSAELDRKLGGGIPLGSLSLVEGQSDAGKSVLIQHLAYGCLRSGIKVAYYTTEDSVRGLIGQMSSLGMEVTDHFLIDRLRIYSMSLAAEETGSEAMANQLLEHVEHLPEEFTCVMVDSVTNLIVHSSDTHVVQFFSRCKELCDNGRTIFLVAHSHAFGETLLIRVRSLCDAHLRLRLEEVGERLMKVLEVAKVRSAERSTGNIVTFDVEPGRGIQVVPVSRVRA
jgi:flagellar protein FlaH